MVATFFRLFFPEEDESRKYGLQEARLASALMDVFALDNDCNGSGAILNGWDGDNAVGCLGTQLRRVLEKGSPVSVY